jgi:hypothetical protein
MATNSSRGAAVCALVAAFRTGGTVGISGVKVVTISNYVSGRDTLSMEIALEMYKKLFPKKSKNNVNQWLVGNE